LAEISEHHEQIRAAGAQVAALSVDVPERSEALRQRDGIVFPLLSDPDHHVVEAWGLFDPKEKGGIARPATFVIDPDRRIRLRSLDGVASRLHAADLVTYLRASPAGRVTAPPQRRVLIPSLPQMARTLLPALRLTLFGRPRLD